ncbi:MAG: hypothetical protein L0271_00195 [Gemmatimonadetes bacterium]|nr:hypothetical protein [Gemmatimonadota bacterium]
MLRHIALILTVWTGAGCASGGGPADRQDRNVITLDEIAAAELVDAYEIVQALRPEFLRTRGSASIRAPDPIEAVVYIDGVKTGPPETLRSVRREVLREIRYIDSREATTRYGTGHRGGAILVTTR